MTARHDRKRGRHKKRASRETRDWEREHLIPPCPSWMPRSTYLALAALRNADVRPPKDAA